MTNHVPLCVRVFDDEHDAVVKAVYLNSMDLCALANVEGDQMVHIDGMRPDVVELADHDDGAPVGRPRAEHEGWRSEIVRSPIGMVYEVETDATTTLERARDKWERWVRIGIELNVVVPFARVDDARCILRELEFEGDVNLWAYRMAESGEARLYCPTGLSTISPREQPPARRREAGSAMARGAFRHVEHLASELR